MYIKNILLALSCFKQCGFAGTGAGYLFLEDQIALGKNSTLEAFFPKIKLQSYSFFFVL